MKDGRLVDGAGGALLLRGVNLSQTAKSAPFHPIEIDDDAGYAALRAPGPVAVRYLTSWAAIEPDDGVFDEAYLDEMGARLARLAAAGHLIVLDLHQDLFGVGFAGGNGAPRFACDEGAYASFTPVSPWFRNYSAPEVQGCFDALFENEELLERMAHALRRAVDVARAAAGAHLIGVDLLNEPHPGSRTPAAFDALLMRYYEIATTALEGTDVALFFEPNVLHNLGEPTTFSRAPAAHAVFSPHLYPVDAELGQYQDAGALAALVERYAAEADALEAPLLIGELGPLLDDPQRLRYVDDALYLLDEKLAGAFAWDWSEVSDRGLLHDGADDVAVRMLRPHARRVAATRATQSFDPDEGTFALSFDEDGVSGASEIVWPATWGEPSVDVSDGEVSVDGDLLRWRHAPSVSAHSLTLTRK